MANPAGPLLLCLALATPLQAGDLSYGVYLGGRQLGWILYAPATDRHGPGTLRSAFANTPLGVFDGSYAGTSRPSSKGGQVEYRGTSTAARKERTVTINHTDEGRVTATEITPAKDQTSFTRAANVPPGVLDPVEAFGALVMGKACPKAFRLYDGRRVVQVTPIATEVSGTVTTCDLSYHVILGPGHLSPLYVKTIAIQAQFDTAAAETGATRIALRSGMFEVQFRRN